MSDQTPTDEPLPAEMWRTCSNCRLPRNVDQFRQSGAPCRECENRLHNRQKKKSHKERQKEELLELVSNLNDGSAGSLSAGILAHGIVREYGGLVPFIHDWSDILKKARDEAIKSGHFKQALDAFYRIATLVVAAEGRGAAGIDLKKLSDEELEDLIGRQLVNRDRSLLARLAAQDGYDLVPAKQPPPYFPPPPGLPEIERVPPTNASHAEEPPLTQTPDDAEVFCGS